MKKIIYRSFYRSFKSPVISQKTIGILKRNDSGFCIYKGVLIALDEDYDNRVFKAVDYLRKKFRSSNLIAIREAEGSLILVWEKKPPEIVNISVFNDTWCIEENLLNE